MEQSWRELFKLLLQLGGSMERLEGIARAKTAAVMRDDINGLNDCMKQEQVVSLSLRSMDMKRTKLLEGLGLGNLKLRELPERCPQELRGEAQQVYETVRNKYMLYRSAADVARTTLEANLHMIEKIIDDDNARLETQGGLTDIRA